MIVSAAVLKLIIGYVVFHFLASLTQGQTYFDLRNLNLHSSVGDVDAPVFDAQGVPLAGTNYLAELWGSATPDSLRPLLWVESGRRFFAPFHQRSTGQDTPGYFWGVTWIEVPNLMRFDWAWLQVRAWDRRLGSTYEEVVARGLGGYGESPLFYAQGTPGPHYNPPLEGAPLIGLKSFKLRPATAVLMRQIRRQDNQVVIEWSPGFKRYQLQGTSDLGQAWQNVGGQTTITSVTNVINSSTMKFFRVIGYIE